MDKIAEPLWRFSL